jgi:nitrate/nitrite transporter NarK
MMAMIPSFSGERLAGSAAGGVNAFWQLGSTIVPAVIGMVFGATGSFQAAFLTLAAGPILAIIPMVAMAKPTVNPPLPIPPSQFMTLDGRQSHSDRSHDQPI